MIKWHKTFYKFCLHVIDFVFCDGSDLIGDPAALVTTDRLWLKLKVNGHFWCFKLNILLKRFNFR